MNHCISYKKDSGRLFGLVLFLFLVCQPMVYGATVAKVEKNKVVLDLTKFNATASKIGSSVTSKMGWTFTGSSVFTRKISSGSNKPLLLYKKGNTTYIFPYKVTNKVPRFKTPEAPKF